MKYILVFKPKYLKTSEMVDSSARSQNDSSVGDSKAKNTSPNPQNTTEQQQHSVCVMVWWVVVVGNPKNLDHTLGMDL